MCACIHNSMRVQDGLHQFSHLVVRNLTWARAYPYSIPDPYPIPKTMCLITLVQPRHLGTSVTKPGILRNSQSLPDPRPRLSTSLPAISCKVCRSFFLISRTLLTPPQSPTFTVHSRITKQTRQLCTTLKTIPQLKSIVRNIRDEAHNMAMYRTQQKISEGTQKEATDRSKNL